MLTTAILVSQGCEPSSESPPPNAAPATPSARQADPPRVEAQQWLTAAASEADHVSDETQRTTVRLRIAIALAKLDDTDTAARIVASHTNAPGMFFVYRELAAASAREGHLESALNYVNQINDGAARARAEAAVIGALADAGHVDRALELLHQFASDQAAAQSQAAALVVKALASAGQISECAQPLTLITQPHDQAEAHSAIAMAQAKTGPMDAARQSFHEARQCAARIEPREARAYSQRQLVSAMSEAGRLCGSLDLFVLAKGTAQHIEDAQTQVQAFSAIAVIETQMSDLPAAAETFARALEATERVGPTPRHMIALGYLAEAQLRAHNRSEAHKLTEQARLLASRVNASDLAAPLAQLARLLVQLDDVNEGRKEFDSALSYARQQTVEAQTPVLSYIALQLALCAREPSHRDLLAMARQAADDIPDPAARANAYHGIAATLAPALPRLELASWIAALPEAHDRALAFLGAAEGLISHSDDEQSP